MCLVASRIELDGATTVQMTIASPFKFAAVTDQGLLPIGGCEFMIVNLSCPHCIFELVQPVNWPSEMPNVHPVTADGPFQDLGIFLD